VIFQQVRRERPRGRSFGASREGFSSTWSTMTPLGAYALARGDPASVWARPCRSPRTSRSFAAGNFSLEGRALPSTRHFAILASRGRHHGRTRPRSSWPVLPGRPRSSGPARSSVLHASASAPACGRTSGSSAARSSRGRSPPLRLHDLLPLAGRCHTRASTFFIYDFAAAASPSLCVYAALRSSAVRSTGLVSSPRRDGGGPTGGILVVAVLAAAVVGVKAWPATRAPRGARRPTRSRPDHPARAASFAAR